MKTFFKDLKVIELANVLAGPAVGMFFSELGAEVIKIENKLTNGDVTRSWKLANENKDNSVSAYYASVNWNKKIIFSDLSLEDEKQKIYDLIRTADIVISNYKNGDDKKLGMDHETFKKINPQIIYAHITGFGTEKKRTAYDLVLQAETGFMHLNGTAESGPLKMPVALIDILAAHQLKEAILIALIKKMRTNEGSFVNVSLYDTAISSLANQASNYLMTGKDPERSGSLHPNIAPYGELFETSDTKKIVLAIGSDKQFFNLCDILLVRHLASEERFFSNTQRVIHRKELYEILRPLILGSDSIGLMKQFIEKDVPAGIIRSVKEVMNDPGNSNHILTETSQDDVPSKRVKSIAFSVNN